MTRRPPERTEQAAIVQLLRTLGASVYVLGTTRRKGDHPGTMQTPGIPDLYVHWPKPDPIRIAIGMWIEVKAQKGKLSQAQQTFQKESHDALMPHLVGGLDVVIAWCQQNGKLKPEHQWGRTP